MFCFTPGGNSFSAFTNQYAKFGTMAYEEADSFVRANEGATTYSAGVELENGSPLPAIMVAPMGIGAVVDGNYVGIDLSFGGSLAPTSAEEFEITGSAESGSSVLAAGSAGATFSYQTSAEVSGAGPSSDAFLVRVGSVLVWGHG